jgi:pyruvate formate lyase activating enzyme
MSEGGRVQCVLCPHACVLKPGERGRCSVRLNIDGALISLVYGKPVAVNVDPVEKKPLFHFLPGSDVLSIATAGCNLRCLFCQNWEISQSDPEDVSPYDLPPEAVVEQALAAGCGSIAYTYTEPIVFFEYMRDTAVLAREAGLRNIMVTAGYINQGPLAELAPLMDAANIDLKSIREDFYRDICGATLQPVLDCIMTMKSMGTWVEVTNLIVPTLNDSQEDIEELSDWMLEYAGPDTPLHFSRFFPMYRLPDLPPTPLEVLEEARATAKDKGMRFVYVGNAVSSEGAVTVCPNCGAAVMARQGYIVTSRLVDENGLCGMCSAPVPGVWK